MGRVEIFIAALKRNSDGRYHYYDGRAGGIGCSDFVKLCLREAGIITYSESFWAAGKDVGVLADTCLFQKIAWSTANMRKGDILWSHGHHVAVWAGYDDSPYGSVWEAAPESTHSKASCGTGVGLHIGHTYRNCGTGSYVWTCIYRIIDIEAVKEDIKKEVVTMDKTQNLKTLIGFLPTIQRGSTGTVVKGLQTILKKYGWYSDMIDGNAGPNTVKGIKLMQAALGIEPDGVAGPVTWTAILI